MNTQANGTEAKEVVMYFIGKTAYKISSPNDVARMMNNVKQLLVKNYTARDIIKVIDYLVDVKHVNMYSFGYVSKTIDDVLTELAAVRETERAAQYVKEMSINPPQIEVSDDGESGKRNRDKLSRFGAQSRLREKYSFDMLEGREQTD